MKTNDYYLREAIKCSFNARKHGNHPFGAILVDAAGEIILIAENTVSTEKDCTGHAETNLARMASKKYDSSFLNNCTIYTSAESCVMCAGAIYWSGIGKVVFGLSEKKLLETTGMDNEANLTFQLPMSDVFEAGQRHIEIIGPLLEEEALEAHHGFWEQYK